MWGRTSGRIPWLIQLKTLPEQLCLPCLAPQHPQKRRVRSDLIVVVSPSFGGAGHDRCPLWGSCIAASRPPEDVGKGPPV